MVADLGNGTIPNYPKGTLLGTPNREPQEYSRNIMEYKDPARYIPIIYLLYSWGSLFGVSSRVPLYPVLGFSFRAWELRCLGLVFLEFRVFGFGAE